MKYIKTFESVTANEPLSNNKILKNFHKNLKKLVEYYYNDSKIVSKFEENVMSFSYSAPDGRLMTFMDFNFDIHNNNYEIFFEFYYIGVDVYMKTQEFQEYFASLAKPLSFSHDNDVEFNLHEDKFKELISLLTVEEYELRKKSEKYNL